MRIYDLVCLFDWSVCAIWCTSLIQRAMWIPLCGDSGMWIIGATMCLLLFVHNV